MSTITETLKLPFLRLNRAKAEEFAYLQLLNTLCGQQYPCYTKRRETYADTASESLRKALCSI